VKVQKYKCNTDELIRHWNLIEVDVFLSEFSSAVSLVVDRVHSQHSKHSVTVVFQWHSNQRSTILFLHINAPSCIRHSAQSVCFESGQEPTKNNYKSSSVRKKMRNCSQSQLWDITVVFVGATSEGNEVTVTEGHEFECTQTMRGGVWGGGDILSAVHFLSS